MIYCEQTAPLFVEMEKLQNRFLLHSTVTPDYFEPGMMEYLEQSYGVYDQDTGKMTLRFDARGTRYDGRSERIEYLQQGDAVLIVREPTNAFNPNNFTLQNSHGENIGNMPAELCNTIAPLYDAGIIQMEQAFVSYVEPLSKRNRHARQAIVYVELTLY